MVCKYRGEYAIFNFEGDQIVDLCVVHNSTVGSLLWFTWQEKFFSSWWRNVFSWVLSYSINKQSWEWNIYDFIHYKHSSKQGFSYLRTIFGARLLLCWVSVTKSLCNMQLYPSFCVSFSVFFETFGTRITNGTDNSKVRWSSVHSYISCSQVVKGVVTRLFQNKSISVKTHLSKKVRQQFPGSIFNWIGPKPNPSLKLFQYFIKFNFN